MNITQQPAGSVADWRTLCPVGEELVLSGNLDHRPEVAARQIEAWLDAGVTCVVDCRAEWSDEWRVTEQAPELAYVHVGVDDDGGPQPLEWFDAGVEAARHLIDSRGGKVLIHCHMGINRGPSMGLAFLLDSGWDVTNALDAIRSSRPMAAIAYAEDAVEWYLRRCGASPDAITAERRRVAGWLESNDVDLSAVMRAVRTSM